MVEDLLLEIHETPSLIHQCTVSPPVIQLSSRVLELLWAQAYAYWFYYTEELAGVLPDGQEIDPRRKPKVSQALDLLGWAISEIKDKTDNPWPASYPSPELDPGEDITLRMTDDLALMAAAFILHHELAHIRLGHSAPSNIEEDRDADYAAADWIMDGVTPGTIQFQKRALWISVALLYIVTFGVYTGYHDGETHPKDYNRLLYTLKRHVEPNMDEVWGFVAGMFDLMIQDARSVASKGPFDNFHQYCNALADHLAELEAS